MDQTRKWNAIWIGAGIPEKAAPYLRQVFQMDSLPKDAHLYICSAGWHTVRINGVSPDDRVLAPSVSQYDRRVFYVDYPVAEQLRKGKNTIVLSLGNSLYNDFSHSASDFIRATWRDRVKVICELVADGKTVLSSSRQWKVTASPVIYNNIRCGEHYDARLEIPGLDQADFDDSAWPNAVQAKPPGGILVLEDAPPCRVCRKIQPIAVHRMGKFAVSFDFGTNITGRCNFKFRGSRGKEIRILYGERVRENGDVDREHIAQHTAREDGFQEERYILKGEGEECWHSNFTYHGFRAVKLRWEGPDSVDVEAEACFIHTDFESNGEVETSNPILNSLQTMTRQSYLSNFTGIPTDCPHREKNGWTGDAQLAMQTGCWNFNVEKPCTNFLKTFRDTQRPSGQLPAIAPVGGFGWNWGNGPAWDALLFEYPWQMYCYYGNRENILESYDAFRRYLDYLDGMEYDGLLHFGMSDWANWEPREDFISSAYYIHFCRRMAQFARIAGRDEDILPYSEKAERLRRNFNDAWGHPDGGYHGNEMTSLAAPLFFDIVGQDLRAETARKLAERVRENQWHPDFGILGAKWVPRALSANGFIDDACRMFSQTEYPGWGFWAKSGSSTLWEGWSGISSLNHIMYGDVSAWMFEYLGGLSPDWENPAFKHFTIRPLFPRELKHVSVAYHSRQGTIRSSWKRSEEGILCEFEIPESSRADLILPGQKESGISGNIKLLIQTIE